MPTTNYTCTGTGYQCTGASTCPEGTSLDTTKTCQTGKCCSSVKTDGVCGATNKVCNAGTVSGVAETTTDYVWTCVGLNGGKTDNCDIPKSSTYNCNRCSDTFYQYFAQWNTDVGTVCEEDTWNQSKLYTKQCLCTGGTTNYSQHGYTLATPNCPATDLCTGVTCDTGKTCDKTTGKCNCTNSGEADPHYTCSTNTCQTVTGCGSNSGGCTSPGGSCGTIACTSPSSNPHFVCSGNTCAEVDTCAQNSGGCTSAGGSCCSTAGQTNPYFTCQGNTCVQANTCGVNSGGCTSAGGSCGTIVTTMPPTNTPVPATPTPQTGNMTLAFSLGFDGIGAAGDHALPCTAFASCASNKNLKPDSSKTRDLTVSVLDQNKVNKTPDLKTTVTYDSSTGTFKGTTTFNLTPGNYTVKVKSPGLLAKTLVSIQNLVSGTNQIPTGNLTTGDIDTEGSSNNALDIYDYNVLISCSIYTGDNHEACNKNSDYMKLSDLNSDGVVDIIDYQLFLREVVVQNGD